MKHEQTELISAMVERSGLSRKDTGGLWLPLWRASPARWLLETGSSWWDLAPLKPRTGRPGQVATPLPVNPWKFPPPVCRCLRPARR